MNILNKLVSMDLYVFPIYRATRKPAIHNWANLATNDATKFLEGFESCTKQGRKYFVRPNAKEHALAVYTKPPLAVIDIDQHSTKHDAKTTLFRLKERYKLPETFTVTTKRKGYHLYYNIQNLQALEVLRFSTFKSLFPNVDLKLRNSFVVAPDGKDYQIVNDCPIADFPTAPLFELALAAERVSSDTEVEQPIEFENMDNYKNYIDKVAQNGARKIMMAKLGEINITLFSRTAALAGFAHYGFYNRQEIGNAMLKTLQHKAKLERWNDWEAYKPKAISTIKSALDRGLEHKKYIIISKYPKPLHIHDFKAELKQAKDLGFEV